MIDSGRGIWAGSGGFSLSLKSGWRRMRSALGRGHSLAKVMEVGKCGWGLVGKVWDYSS